MNQLRPCTWFRLACFDCGRGHDIAVATRHHVDEYQACPACKSGNIEKQLVHIGQTSRTLPAIMDPVQFHYDYATGAQQNGRPGQQSQQRGSKRGAASRTSNRAAKGKVHDA